MMSITYTTGTPDDERRMVRIDWMSQSALSLLHQRPLFYETYREQIALYLQGWIWGGAVGQYVYSHF